MIGGKKYMYGKGKMMKEGGNVLIGDIRRKCEGHGGGKYRADHQLVSQTSHLPDIFCLFPACIYSTF